jgi:hypothetical protein
MSLSFPKQRTRRWTIETRQSVADQVHCLWDTDGDDPGRMLGRIQWSVWPWNGDYAVTLDIRDFVHRRTIRHGVLRLSTAAEIREELARCKAQLAEAVAS